MMEASADILGYIECKTCNDTKAIKQGKGKRSRFVHGRCKCGPDTRTGVAAQNELSAFKPLDIVKALIAEKQLPPANPNNEQSKPNTNGINEQSQTESEPNTDEQYKPNNEPENEALNISKCVGLGSVIGLVFGLIIR
ncbi:hypothetical protein [Moritella sp. 36]|uniref:hypothetical protein n=1 Tax=Moritella sp. 36 TaxID=2746233 RepID=UPI001BA44C0E|nr:hypothetical protein [Moritella sp. 36]